MKKLFLVLLISLSSRAFCSDEIILPTEGFSSAESIRNCELQLAELKDYKRSASKNSNGYVKVDSHSDSFIYIFTTPAEPAHPAMLKITLRRMEDFRHPKSSDIETFGSYAGNESEFFAWGSRVTYDLGRGFGYAVNQNN